MGGLRKPMPITFWTFLIGTLSLAGHLPARRLLEKDEILSDAWAHEQYLFWIAARDGRLTAFYMFRVIFLTFFGEYRGGARGRGARRGARRRCARAHDGARHAARTSRRCR